jgi:hypothetical protein
MRVSMKEFWAYGISKYPAFRVLSFTFLINDEVSR